MSEGTIVGKSGEYCYLLHTSGELGTPGAMGRVLDLAQGKLFPETSLYNIVRFGNWDEYKGPQDILPDLLKRVREAAQGANHI